MFPNLAVGKHPSQVTSPDWALAQLTGERGREAIALCLITKTVRCLLHSFIHTLIKQYYTQIIMKCILRGKKMNVPKNVTLVD